MVDLHKEDHGYTPLDVLTLESPLLALWQAGGAVLDSAFRTGGGRYEWTYRCAISKLTNHTSQAGQAI